MGLTLVEDSMAFTEGCKLWHLLWFSMLNGPLTLFTLNLALAMPLVLIIERKIKVTGDSKVHHNPKTGKSDQAKGHSCSQSGLQQF